MGIIIAFVLIAIIAGYLIFFNTSTRGAGNPSYPRDSGVFTTLEKTVIPVPVPLNSPNLLPYQVANFSLYGYGVWQYGGGLEYEKRLDIMSPAYTSVSSVNTETIGK